MSPEERPEPLGPEERELRDLLIRRSIGPDAERSVSATEVVLALRAVMDARIAREVEPIADAVVLLQEHAPGSAVEPSAPLDASNTRQVTEALRDSASGVAGRDSEARDQVAEHVDAELYDDAPPEGVIPFLMGSGTLDGCWFGERPDGRPPFWWRLALEAEVRRLRALPRAEREPVGYASAVELEQMRSGELAWTPLHWTQGGPVRPVFPLYAGPPAAPEDEPDKRTGWEWYRCQAATPPSGPCTRPAGHDGSCAFEGKPEAEKVAGGWTEEEPHGPPRDGELRYLRATLERSEVPPVAAPVGDRFELYLSDDALDELRSGATWIERVWSRKLDPKRPHRVILTVPAPEQQSGGGA